MKRGRDAMILVHCVDRASPGTVVLCGAGVTRPWRYGLEVLTGDLALTTCPDCLTIAQAEPERASPLVQGELSFDGTEKPGADGRARLEVMP